jgi:hypothetical protein
MNLPRSRVCQHACVLASLTAGILLWRGLFAGAAVSQNPIARIARIARLLNTQIVENKNNVTLIDGRISACAPPSAYPLITKLGYLGACAAVAAKPPPITLDLGAEMPMGKIILIATQREFLQVEGIFPKCLIPDVSRNPDFTQSTRIFLSGQIQHLPPDGAPAPFNGRETVRYVRLAMQEGHMKGTLDLFALSEIEVGSEAMRKGII